MNTSSIIINLAMIFVVMGLYFAIKSILLWRKTNIAGIGVEVTKNRSFLQINFLLILLVGAFAGIHVFLEFLQFTITIESPYINVLFYVLYYSTLLAIVFVLLILSFKWYKLLSKINQWDTRWVSGKK